MWYMLRIIYNLIRVEVVRNVLKIRKIGVVFTLTMFFFIYMTQRNI
jgi:hypothetical protein